MIQIVYSTSASYAHTRGWDAFDRMVLWAVAARPGQCFNEVLHLIPDGVLLYLVRRSLEFLIADGLIQRRRLRAGASGAVVGLRSVYEATPAGRAMLAAALERKAA